MRENHKNIEDILAVIVLYKQKLETSLTLISLNKSLLKSGRLLKIIIYDNGPDAYYQEKNFRFLQFEVSYIHNFENPGVSKAYNVAAAVAKQTGKTWLLLLDQDTEFPENAIEIYLKAINEYSQQKLFVPVLHSPNGNYSPCKYYFKSGFIWKHITPGIYNLKHKNLLNSGILIDLNLYLKAGGYKEKIKLYFSDFNFIDRLKSIHKEFVVIDAVCNHKLSDLTNVDLSASKNRFKIYCEGSFHSAEKKMDYIPLFITVFLRSMLLSFRYKNLIFMKIFFTVYF